MESPFWHAAGLLKAIGLFLSGVCHQLPEHTLFLAGTQMPFCARCTGTYLGASLALGNFWLRGRSRASRLPPLRVLAMLGLFVAFWAIDGLNSYWHFLSGNVLLYTPSNVLRLAAGLVNGLALASLVFPLFNATLLPSPDQERPIASLRELGGILLQIAALGLLLLANVGVLLYPLLLADVLSVLLLLGMVNTMIVILLLHWENRAAGWRQATLPLGLGLALSIVEVSSIALFRAVLWNRLL